MRKRSEIVYAVTRAVMANDREEFYAASFPEKAVFTPTWQLAMKVIHPVYKERTTQEDDMPVGYLIPLEDDDE